MNANISWVTSHLATGGDLSDDPEVAEAQLQELVGEGVTLIVDCRQEWSDETFVSEQAPWIAYLHLGVDDHGGSMPSSWWEAGTEAVHRALATGAKVLVHCHMGINRGPSLTFAALLREGWDPVTAIDRIRRARPIAGVLYAEDALDWWHRRNAESRETADEDRVALAEWRAQHPLDVVRIIRQIRSGEPPLKAQPESGDATHLVVKVNTGDIYMLSDHMDAARLHGSVWFGRDAQHRPPAAKRIDQLEHQLLTGVPTWVHFHPTGANADVVPSTRARLLDIQVVSPPPRELITDIYGAGDPIDLWLRVTDFERIDRGWIERHLTLTDGRPIGPGLKNQTSPLYARSR